jgi:hypothetical protein
VRLPTAEHDSAGGHPPLPQCRVSCLCCIIGCQVIKGADMQLAGHLPPAGQCSRVAPQQQQHSAQHMLRSRWAAAEQLQRMDGCATHARD